jgi:hypothetical protein
MHRNLFAIGFSVALICPSTAFAQSNHADADAIVDAWAAAFNECSADKLAALYDPAATLWGTNSPDPGLHSGKRALLLRHRLRTAAADQGQPGRKNDQGIREFGAVSAGCLFVRA